MASQRGVVGDVGELYSQLARPLEQVSAVRAAGPDQLAEQHEQLERLSALPARQRTVLLLQAAGLSYEETAGALGMSRRTVERQIMRGRRKLRTVAHAQE